jgi:hypothetical protein
MQHARFQSNILFSADVKENGITVVDYTNYLYDFKKATDQLEEKNLV